MKYMRFALFCLLSLSTGCAVIHHYDSYQGEVIDMETRKPISGAAVLAVYYTQSYGPGGSIKHYVDAQELTTGINGEFNVSEKTVIVFRPFQSFEPYAWFTIYAPGYGYYPNYRVSKPIFTPSGTLPDNKSVTIELQKLSTNDERLRFPAIEFDVPYEKQEKLIELINQEMKSLGASGQYSKDSFNRR